MTPLQMGDSPLSRLIAALARQDSEDYLREQAAAGAAKGAAAENPVLPATGEAA